MNRLDKQRPYGKVSGLTGVAYEQNGCFFTPHGFECDEHGKPLEDPEPAPAVGSPTRALNAAPEPAPAEDDLPQPPSGDEPVVTRPAPAPIVERRERLEKLGWHTVKKLVEHNGGEYHGKGEGIDFLCDHPSPDLTVV
jgi:hypothetical protein